MKHELWVEGDEQTFCLTGPLGKDARALLGNGAKLVWTVEAVSHLDAMQQYYAYMDWGIYKTDFPERDAMTYRELGWES